MKVAALSPASAPNHYCSALVLHTHPLSSQHMFFFLVQTEQGDIFKVTLETDDDIVSYQTSN